MASVEKRSKNTFRIGVVIGYKTDGTPIRERKTIKAANKTEARRIANKFEAEVLSGKYIKPDKTKLNDFYNDWLNKYAKYEYSPDTLQDYINILKARILPKYGDTALSDISVMHVVNFMDDLRKDGQRLDGKKGKLSDSTIRNCYKAFNSILDCAATWKLIPENPAKSVKPPNASKKVKLEYSSDLIFSIIEAINKEPAEKQALFWTTFITGCRQGEVVALEDKHVLEDKKAIYFEQSITEVVGEGLKIKQIKNGIEGVASIPDELLVILQKLIKSKRKDMMRLRDRWYMDDRIFIFSNEFGKPLRPDSVSQWWSRFIKRNKLEKVRFHDLRHLSVTFLIGKNVPIKSISERARHSRIGTTMDLYGHHILEVDQVAAEHFSEFFREKA